MRIATLGCGQLARVLGGAWADLGHEVYFGSRDPEKAWQMAREIGRGTRGGSNVDAAAFGEVILHTVRQVPSSFLPVTSVLATKIIIDCTNRADVSELGEAGWASPSLAELVQADVPAARVVKALNHLPADLFEHPPEVLQRMNVAAPFCGDEHSAKLVVEALLEQLGLRPVDCGRLSAAAMLEAHGTLVRTMSTTSAGPVMTLSISELPAAAPRFGPRPVVVA